MGLFLETVIIPGCKEAEARSFVKAIEEAYSYQENMERADIEKYLVRLEDDLGDYEFEEA